MRGENNFRGEAPPKESAESGIIRNARDGIRSIRFPRSRPDTKEAIEAELLLESAYRGYYVKPSPGKFTWHEEVLGDIISLSRQYHEDPWISSSDLYALYYRKYGTSRNPKRTHALDVAVGNAIRVIANTIPPLIELRMGTKAKGHIIAVKMCQDEKNSPDSPEEKTDEAVRRALREESRIEILIIRIARICDASKAQWKILRGVLKRARRDVSRTPGSPAGFPIWMAAESEEKARAEFETLKAKLPPDFILEKNGKLFLNDEFSSLLQ